MQIQKQESPLYDEIFVDLGAFHIQMAFFKAIGKYIDSSGLVDIFTSFKRSCGGGGVSVNAFIDSKHFNRCKQMYPLLSAALQVLHFNRFLSDRSIDINDFLDDILQLKSNPTRLNEPLQLRDSLVSLLDEYRNFYDLALPRDHGKTAQFPIRFIELILIYHRFS